MEENNYVIFKKQYGNIKRPRVKELSINLNGVKIYEKEQSMIINIIVPVEDSTKTVKYFEEFNLGEEFNSILLALETLNAYSEESHQ